MIPTLLPTYQRQNKQPDNWQKAMSFFRFLADDPTADKQEGFYARSIWNPARSESCLQIVLYYRKQSFPYHVNDYHPIFAYFNASQQLTRILYDNGHHRSRSVAPSSSLAFTVQYPWHGYAVGRSLFASPLRAAVFDLTDALLVQWWLQPGMPQFKLRSKFVDPWHPGLAPSPGGATGSFRDEAVCPRCGHTELLDRMDLDGRVFRLPILCPKGHRYTVLYDAVGLKLWAEQ